MMAADRRFRREDTLAARIARAIAPQRGPAYFGSAPKRVLDLAAGLGLAALSLPLIVALAGINRLLEPAHSILFRQARVGHAGEPLPVFKIRSLVPAAGAEAGRTPFGEFIRHHFLDELPQLLQVLIGELSLVGIRVLPRDIYEGLEAAWSPARYRAWRAAYRESALGLTGIHQIWRQDGKQDERRFWRDLFYTRHASLGLDLYLLWRTFLLLTRPRPRHRT